MNQSPPIDPAYSHELARLAELARQYVAVHDARELYGGSLDAELLLLGAMVAQAANVYNLAPPGGLLNPGVLFTGGPPAELEP